MNLSTGEASPSKCQAGGLVAETPASDPLLEALYQELHEYRKESEYMKGIIKLARLWSDKRADREFHSVQRKVIELQRENAALKKQIKQLVAAPPIQE